MEEQERLAGMAEPDEEVVQDQEADQQEEQPEVEAEQPDDKPKKETARERRERDKAAKHRLREEHAEATRKLQEAEHKLARIKEARQSEISPAESDFDDHFEYVAAKAVWKHSQAAVERDATHAATEAEQARREADAIRDREAQLLQQNWQAQAAEAQGRYADFEKVVARPGLFPQGTALPMLIQSSEMAADLAYHIASDRSLHDALVSMTPVEVAREIGRLEARLSLPQSRKASTAPEPISPVRGGSSSSGKDPTKMTPDEYNAWRDAGGSF